MRCLCLLCMVLCCWLSSCRIPVESKDPVLPTAVEKRFNSAGAPIEVRVKLSAATIELTDFLTVVISLHYPETVQPIPPYLAESVYQPLRLLEPPRSRNEWFDPPGGYIQEWTYRFEPLVAGEYTLKAFPVYFLSLGDSGTPPATDSPQQIMTDPIPYRIESIEIEEGADLRDIRSLNLPAYNFLPVAVAGIALLGVIWWIRKRHQPPSLPVAVEPRKPNYGLEAMQRLDQLESQVLMATMDFQRWHTELSDILRSLVENAFGIRAQEQTTEEFLQNARLHAGFNPEQHQMFEAILGLADLVKFAAFDPGPAARRQAMTMVRNFIRSLPE